MTLKDHLRSLGDKEFLEELANSEPRSKSAEEGKEVGAGKEAAGQPDPGKTAADEKPVETSSPRANPKPRAGAGEQAVRADDTIVSITADGRTAKGFVVDSGGTIVTNLHLVGGAEKIRIEFQSGDVFLARVTREDSRRDLALLKIPGTTPTFAPMGSTAGLDVGDSVLVLAKAASPTGQMVQATVCALRRINGTAFVQVDQTLNNQDSGSPIVDRDGKVLGISNVRAGDSTPDVGFAVSVAELKSFISGQ